MRSVYPCLAGFPRVFSEKRELSCGLSLPSPVSLLVDVTVRILCTLGPQLPSNQVCTVLSPPMSKCGNFNPLPFRWTRQKYTSSAVALVTCTLRRLSQQALARTLGSTNPRPIAVHVEPCPTSVSKGVSYPVHHARSCPCTQLRKMQLRTFMEILP